MAPPALSHSKSHFMDTVKRLLYSSSPFLTEFVTTVVMSCTSFLVMYKITKYLQNRELASGDVSALNRHISRILKERGYSLNKHERIIAMDASMDSVPDEQEAFNELGGMAETKEAIIRALVYPMKHPHLFRNQHSLRQFPKGVLLHGPPGTGKTSLARVVAKSCGCAFIHVRKELLGAKYFGESEKMVAAIFSLARKLSPAIIFIDEIESIFPSRMSQSYSHRVHQLQMSIMLENWDGFKAESKIMILGATNLKQALDPAALRRFQYQFKVDIPQAQERVEIMKILLRNDEVDPKFDFNAIACRTKGYSGSDLKSILQEAILLPIHEAMRVDSDSIESLKTEHVFAVLDKRSQRR